MNNIYTIFYFLNFFPDKNSKIEKVYKSLEQIYRSENNLDEALWGQEKIRQLNEARELIVNPDKYYHYISLLKPIKSASSSQKEHNLIQSHKQITQIIGLSFILLGGLFLLKE